MPYVGAIIEDSDVHAWTTTPDGAARNWGPTVDADQLADLIWNMDLTRDRAEVCYPEGIPVAESAS